MTAVLTDGTVVDAPLARPPAPTPLPPPESPSRMSLFAGRSVTTAIVLGPVVALAVGIPLLWGNFVSLRDVIIGTVLYLLTGHGITIGYHRLFAHRSFVANRPLKVALAALGSMAVEGSVIGWVSAHRRHHRFSDREGDPHSPHGNGTGLAAQLRGLVHAHVGWLFTTTGTSESRYAPDLLADRDLVRINNLWALFAAASLALPFGLGWWLSGTIAGALTTLLWAGAVRMMLLHHTTWSINSICHTFGARPFRTKDQSRNVSVLGLVSMGESFHNFHHAYPQSARHGVLPHQLDTSALLIRGFERAGWAREVRWPQADRIAALRQRRVGAVAAKP